MANNWTREQLIVAFNLYCKIPFSKSVQGNPDVIRVAKLIGRTPSAVAFKLGNFGSFDPELKKRGIGGLPNTGKLDKEIWDEFHSNWEELAFQSELLVAQFENKTIEQIADLDLSGRPVGDERESLVRVRVNQSFFRQSVMSIYGSKCCITGLDMPSLLVASHIVPWRSDVANRTNPQNGLCLNSLHDKAFDQGLITITTDFKVKVSARLKESSSREFVQVFFLEYEDREISLPDKFRPESGFLAFHNESVFKS
ncbi:MAG: HNH endonuclease [Chloracidobacterium sp.]|nr:HNH endonuclease [Chloracidobacterium sp.]